MGATDWAGLATGRWQVHISRGLSAGLVALALVGSAVVSAPPATAGLADVDEPGTVWIYGELGV